MSPTAIVFDLDGTLVDTALDLHDTLNVVLARHGRPPIGLDGVRAMVGDGARKLLQRGFAATGGDVAAEDFEAAVDTFFTHYEANLSLHSRPFPGVEAALAALREDGCRLGVCTNKPHRFSVKLLADLGLLDCFDAVLGGDSLPVRKPDPGHLLGTLSAMASEARAGVMVGDSLNDVAAARAAGIPVIAVSFGYTTVPASELGADRTIDTFAELRPALASLCRP